MEFLLVKFAEDRELIIDGNVQGRSNQTIELERGSHTISLKSPPSDFQPQQEEIVLENTTSISPMEVRFEKL